MGYFRDSSHGEAVTRWRSLFLPAFLLAALLISSLFFTARAEAGTIGRANLDGTGVDPAFITLARDPAIWPPLTDVAVDGAHLHWTSGNAIGRARLDGTGVDPSFITLSDPPYRLALDGAHLYWTTPDSWSPSPPAIGRANLDGTGVDESFIAGVDATDVAVDGAHLYWTSGNAIGRARLDGTNVDPAFITPAELYIAGPVTVDDAHVYWGTLLSPNPWGIGRANLDGTGVDESFITDVFRAEDMAVDRAYLYWQGEEGTIGRANLDGSGVDRSFIGFARDQWIGILASGIAVDGSHLYWASRWEPFALGKVRLNKRRGTAKLLVKSPSPGTLVLARTKRVKPARDQEPWYEQPGTPRWVELAIRPRGRAKQRLERRGRARVKAKVTHTPHGGLPTTRTKSLTLKKRR